MVIEGYEIAGQKKGTYVQNQWDDLEGSPREWTPIGIESRMYNGTFDGAGNTVKGIYVNTPGENYVGLFGGSTGTIKNVGGVCGYNFGGTVTGCYNTGNVSGTNNIGGVCGSIYDGTVTGCYNTGTVSGSNSNSSGDVCGSITMGTVTNCYYQSIAETDSADGTTYKTEADFNSGAVCWLLNGSTASDDSVWRQNIGTDMSPVLDGLVVYLYEVSGTTFYSNIKTSPTYNDGVYEIDSADELLWFVYVVNNIDATIDAKLTADIAMNGIDWTTMSSFAGTLDGNGHTISGLNGHKAYTENIHGFIRTLVDGGVVKNLTFTEADIWNHEGSGAISAVIVYTNYGTVENCVVKSSLIQLGNYDALGVVVGVNGGTIRNCASISNTVKRRYEGVKNKAASVFVWSNGSDATIENCMVYDCTYTDASANYAFTQSNTGTITNCYYYESSETISDTVATAKTAEAFASGEVAYLLNGEKTDGTQRWYQTLKTDTYPVPDNTHGTVYSIFACDGTTPAGYSNENKNEPHIDENGDEYCDNCGVIYNGIGAHLAGYSISLNGSIGVNFHMDLTQDVLDDNEAYMLFTLPNGTTQKVMVSDAKAKESAVIEGKTYYIFTCNVAAKEMTDTIQAQLITSDGFKTQVYEYSVREYADRILSGNYDAETQELVKAMLHYGAYSQEWFDYNTTNLANAGLDILDLSEANDWDGFEPIITNNEKVGSFTSAYLTLESDTAINLKFKLADGVSFEDLRVVVDDPLGNVVPVTTDTTENVCLITLTGIKASDLDTTYSFWVIDGESNKSVILYSAMSYACAVANSEMDQKLKNVTAALRIFNLRANQKFEY